MDPVVSSPAPIAIIEELFSPVEEVALGGFVAGYSGLTRDAYTLDLRQYVTWRTERSIALFGARRADIERFGRHLEALGRARATIARRLCTIACFYRYAEQEGLIAVSPAVHVRRPRLDYESHATGLDRNDRRRAVGGRRSRLGRATTPARLDRHAPGRVVRRLARRAGIHKRVGPHTLRHAFITAARSTRGSRCAMSKKRPATPTRERLCATTASGLARLPRHLHRRYLHRRRSPLSRTTACPSRLA